MFPQTHQVRTLDASLLVMPLVKFTGRAPRFVATLERIGEELVLGSLARRFGRVPPP